MNKTQTLIADSRSSGFEVVAADGHTDIIAKRHASTRRVLAGIRIYETGTAVDLTVELSVAKGIRNISVMRSILGMGRQT